MLHKRAAPVLMISTHPSEVSALTEDRRRRPRAAVLPYSLIIKLFSSLVCVTPHWVTLITEMEGGEDCWETEVGLWAVSQSFGVAFLYVLCWLHEWLNSDYLCLKYRFSSDLVASVKMWDVITTNKQKSINNENRGAPRNLTNKMCDTLLNYMLL